MAVSKHEGLSMGSKVGKNLMVNVPADLTPTTNSMSIESNYRMEVKLVMNGCRVSDVVVNMPLAVYPASQLGVALQPPAYWGKDVKCGSRRKKMHKSRSLLALPQASLPEFRHIGPHLSVTTGQ